MNFNKIAKKICSAVTVGAIGLSMTTVPVPVPAAQALGIRDAIAAGVTAAALARQRTIIKKQMLQINTTSQGQEELLKAFQEKYGVNFSKSLNERLNVIMQNLTDGVSAVDPTIRQKPYKYFINNEQSINAACSLAHVMMINTGTFNKIHSDDEIAAIVGHEMGHGQKDHVYAANLKTINRQMIAAVGIAATGSSLASGVIGSIALMQANAHGTKRNEWEADNLAFEYMQNTDYNLGACAAIMQRFVEIMGTNKQSKAAQILDPSDHPNSEARRDNYAKKLYEYSNNHASAEKGEVFVNGKSFVKPVKANNMSGMERSYFVLGTLAKAYHNGLMSAAATVKNGSVYVGNTLIFTPASGDESAQILADRLNLIKN